MALLLKPSSPAPSNTGLARSFQRVTERGIKVLLYCQVLRRGGSQVYWCANRALRVTSTGTYGPGRAPLRGHTLPEGTQLYTKLAYIARGHAIEYWTQVQSSTLPEGTQLYTEHRNSRLHCQRARKCILKTGRVVYTARGHANVYWKQVELSTLPEGTQMYIENR